ncbi:FliH/SctL family protein [uncultured Sphingomonas sp.]|uniref:FliH/SctL family protein n=1 Tax=uncultured Sphingomonas sp. TaxID=158754 RepID=UPI0035CAA3EC
MTIMSEATALDRPDFGQAGPGRAPVADDGFIAGFASRHDAAGAALRQAFSTTNTVFAPRDLKGVAPPSPGDDAVRPRHFAPADRAADPTEGWDPFNADQPATSFVDPVATAHAAGYQEGVAAALAEIAASTDRDNLLVARVAAAIGDGGRLDRERLADHLRQAVLHLVRRVVGESEISADLMARRVAVAVDMLADDAESALLRVHPEDLALVDGRLPATVFAVGDAAIERGGFILETASTIVEDGPDLWLGRLGKALEDAVLPC